MRETRPTSKIIAQTNLLESEFIMSKKQAARTVVSANVRVNGEGRMVRFLSNGKLFRAASRGLPRLSLKLDEANGEVILRVKPQGESMTTLRVAGTNLAKAFNTAVAEFWTPKSGRRGARA